MRFEREKKLVNNTFKIVLSMMMMIMTALTMMVMMSRKCRLPKILSGDNCWTERQYSWTKLNNQVKQFFIICFILNNVEIKSK